MPSARERERDCSSPESRNVPIQLEEDESHMIKFSSDISTRQISATCVFAIDNLF